MTGLLVLDLAVEYRDIRQTHLVVPIVMLLLPATTSILRSSSLIDRLSKRPAIRYLVLLLVF